MTQKKIYEGFKKIVDFLRMVRKLGINFNTDLKWCYDEFKVELILSVNLEQTEEGFVHYSLVKFENEDCDVLIKEIADFFEIGILEV